ERHRCGANVLNLCGQTNLRQAWSVLGNARSIYATDSGLMHMGAAVNPRLTAVFGPTHPARKCPPGAQWAWTDSERYDSRYELFGAVPSGVFFRSMTLGNILDGTQSSPIP
ncbi:MAG: hypothetical protein EOO27_49110, partial [Comamonadaceae bacterium]